MIQPPIEEPVAVPVESEWVMCSVEAYAEIPSDIEQPQHPPSPILTIQVIDEYEYARWPMQRILGGVVLATGIITIFVVGIKNWSGSN